MPKERDDVRIKITRRGPGDISMETVTSVSLTKIKDVLRDHKRFRSLNDKIVAYHTVPNIGVGDETVNYFACESPNPYLGLDPVDVLVAIRVSPDRVTLKTLSDKLFVSDSYTRITGVKLAIETRDDKLRIHMKYDPDRLSIVDSQVEDFLRHALNLCRNL